MLTRLTDIFGSTLCL